MDGRKKITAIYPINSYSEKCGSEFVSPCNHTLDRKHWFHIHTSCCPPSCAVSWYSSCTPSANTCCKQQWPHLLKAQSVQISKSWRDPPRDLFLCSHTQLFAVVSLPISPKRVTTIMSYTCHHNFLFFSFVEVGDCNTSSKRNKHKCPCKCISSEDMAAGISEVIFFFM